MVVPLFVSLHKVVRNLYHFLFQFHFIFHFNILKLVDFQQLLPLLGPEEDHKNENSKYNKCKCDQNSCDCSYSLGKGGFFRDRCCGEETHNMTFQIGGNMRYTSQKYVKVINTSSDTTIQKQDVTALAKIADAQAHLV